MNCDQVREWLSSRLDGETTPEPSDVVDHHFAGCPSCRGWLDAASELRRQTSVRVAPPVPDLSRPILAAFHHEQHISDITVMARWGLGLVAAVQLLAAIPVLLGSDPGASVHVSRELGSWGIALAVGFGVAALRPVGAWGMLPLVAVLVACLSATSLLDIAQSHATAASEAVHVLDIAGLGLLWVVSGRRTPRIRPSATGLRLA